MKHWRANLVLLLLFVFGAIIVERLFFLQIVNEGFYKALARGQQSMTTLAKGERGTVYLQDKSGNLYTLASNQRIPFAFVSPAEVVDQQKTAAKITEVLQLEQDTVLLKLQNSDSLFEPLKKHISETEAQQIRDLDLAGVYIGQEQTRSYPQATLAAHVTGFTNKDGKGQYGIEEHYNSLLNGTEGIKRSVKNPASYFLHAFSQDGQDIVLTIDYNIQSMAEILLERAKENHDIEEGTIIVIDPMTGSILALANYPSFDPNAYSKVQDFSLFQNSAVQKIFEPGSVFKPLTMASGIDAGKITPSTTYEDRGVVRIGGYKVLNYDERVWGTRTMTEVLEYSINTGAVFAEAATGHRIFLDYLSRFGLFEPTDIDLAGEVYSTNKELKKGYEINYATASFGQGIEITPMQLVRAYSALANGGRLPTPHVVDQDMPLSEPIISEKTASQVTVMLVSVTENGFGKSARIPGYYVAGKTGTAQIAYSALGEKKAGYSDKTVQSFIGYAPAFDPRFLILIKLNNPATKTAEYSAIPIFRDLAKYIIDYYQIPPDYEVE